MEIFPQSGTFVTRIPIAALPEAILVRKALEELTAREAAQNAAADQVAALKQLIDRQQKLARQGDKNRFHEADDAFHAAIADAACHPGIWRLILQVKLQLDRYRRLTLPVPGRMIRVVDEHAAVVGGDCRAECCGRQRRYGRPSRRAERQHSRRARSQSEIFRDAGGGLMGEKRSALPRGLSITVLYST